MAFFGSWFLVSSWVSIAFWGGKWNAESWINNPFATTLRLVLANDECGGASRAAFIQWGFT